VIGLFFIDAARSDGMTIRCNQRRSTSLVWLAPLGFALAAVAGCETIDEVSGPRDDYEGTAWIAEDIGGNGVIDFAQSRLSFTKEGRVNGNGGCNSIFGAYQTGDLVREIEINQLELDDTDGETDETEDIEDVEVSAEIDDVEGREPIRFSPMATTHMYCEPAVNDQEAAFLSGLGEAAYVRVQDGIMWLDNAEGGTVMRLSMVETKEE
jgi:heat shock protein HslJ